MKNLTIVAVQVNLPGQSIERLTASGVQAGGANGYQSLLVGLSNTGNVMIKPQGSLQVTDTQGKLVQNLPLKLDTFVPQTSINYPAYIKGQALGAGDYQAVLDLTYGNGQILHYTTKFTVTQQQVAQVFTSSKTQAPPTIIGGDSSGISPWIFVGGGLLLLLVVGNVFYWMVIARRGKAKPATASGHSSLSQFKKPNSR